MSWSDDSVLSRVGSSGSRYGIYYDITPDKSATYTFAVEFASVSGTMFVGIGGASSLWAGYGEVSTTTAGRISVTRTVSSSETLLRAYVFAKTAGSSARVSFAKLELGSTATDWTPSPED